MNVRLKLVTFGLLAAGLFLNISTVSAQSLGGENLGGLNIELSSNFPGPGDTVTLTAKSYSFDIKSASLTWSSAGKVIGKGIGLDTITVTVPQMGKNLTVSLTANPQGGVPYSSSIRIVPSSVDLIVEPNGYVPPAFMGRIPVAYQNNVKIVAVPHISNPSTGAEYDPATLTYKWKQDGTVLESGSGYGSQSVIIPGNIIPRPYNVTVTVSNRDGSLNSSAVIPVDQGSPFVVLYKNDSLYGPLWNSAVGPNVFLGSQRETSIIAAPFGFNSPTSGIGDLDLSWIINGNIHPELAQNKTVTLRAPDNSSGASTVQVNITNKTSELQQGSASVSAIFNSAQ